MKLAAVTLALAVMSLFDFYFMSVGWPVVTVAGGALLLVVSLMYEFHSDRLLSRTTMGMGLLLAVAASSFWGLERYGVSVAMKAPTGIAIGIVLLWNMLTRETAFARNAATGISAILVLHVAVWIAQWMTYQLSGDYLDFTGWYSDNPSRHLTYAHGWEYSGTLVRCTGLFAEPAIYSTFAYMCIAVRFIQNGMRPRLLDWIAMSTMVATVSVSGIALAGAATLMAITSIRVRSRAIAIGAIAAAVFAPALYGVGSAYFFDRVQRIDNDSSAQSRYQNGFEYIAAQDDIVIAVGRGIGSYTEAVGRGSGVLDLLVYTGVVGTVAFFASFARMFFWSRGGLVPFILWLPVILAAPLQTNLFWWVWSGLLIMPLTGSTTTQRDTSPCESSPQLSPLDSEHVLSGTAMVQPAKT